LQSAAVGSDGGTLTLTKKLLVNAGTARYGTMLFTAMATWNVSLTLAQLDAIDDVFKAEFGVPPMKFFDRLTTNASVTRREPDQAFSFGANGATMPDSGTFHNCSLSWGTITASQLLANPATIADGKMSSFEIQLHSKSGTQQTRVHVYADASTINNVVDSFYAQADGTNIKIYKKVTSSDTQLATVALGFTDGDKLKLVVTKNGSNWNVEAFKNGVSVCSATGQAHAGSLGRIALWDTVNVIGGTLTVKNGIGDTNG
jgi:hypothetical protein